GPGDPGSGPGDPGDGPGDPGSGPGDPGGGPGGPGSGPGDPSDGPSDPFTPSDPGSEPQPPARPDLVVIVDGRPAPIGRATDDVEGDRSVRVVEIDGRRLAELVQDAEPGINLVIPPSEEGDTDILRGRLNGATVKLLEAKQAVIELQTDR